MLFVLFDPWLFFCSLELWYNSVLVLLAGYMNNAEVSISAFSIWYVFLNSFRYSSNTVIHITRHAQVG